MKQQRQKIVEVHICDECGEEIEHITDGYFVGDYSVHYAKCLAELVTRVLEKTNGKEGEVLPSLER